MNLRESFGGVRRNAVDVVCKAEDESVSIAILCRTAMLYGSMTYFVPSMEIWMKLPCLSIFFTQFFTSSAVMEASNFS